MAARTALHCTHRATAGTPPFWEETQKKRARIDPIAACHSVVYKLNNNSLFFFFCLELKIDTKQSSKLDSFASNVLCCCCGSRLMKRRRKELSHTLSQSSPWISSIDDVTDIEAEEKINSMFHCLCSSQQQKSKERKEEYFRQRIVISLFIIVTMANPSLPLSQLQQQRMRRHIRKKEKRRNNKIITLFSPMNVQYSTLNNCITATAAARGSNSSRSLPVLYLSLSTTNCWVLLFRLGSSGTIKGNGVENAWKWKGWNNIKSRWRGGGGRGGGPPTALTIEYVINAALRRRRHSIYFCYKMFMPSGLLIEMRQRDVMRW